MVLIRRREILGLSGSTNDPESLGMTVSIWKFIEAIKYNTMINVNLLYDSRAIGYWRRGALVESLTKKRAKSRSRKRLLAMVAMGLWVVAALVLIVPVVPYALYGLFPETTATVADSLGETVDVETSQFGAVVYEEPVYVPPVDESLPRENRLVIEKIGFDSQIGEAAVEEVEEVLRKGPWRVSDMGTPVLRHAPMVVAAHRFGYLAWTNQYRRENSFYNLPKLENGDRIEIIWEQRKYVYEVYGGYTDDELSEESYQADLVLYTCEVLNSNRRVVRLARLVEDMENVKKTGGFGQVLSYGVEN